MNPVEILTHNRRVYRSQSSVMLPYMSMGPISRLSSHFLIRMCNTFLIHIVPVNIPVVWPFSISIPYGLEIIIYLLPKVHNLEESILAA
jgi:hypothetical protein